MDLVEAAVVVRHAHRAEAAVEAGCESVAVAVAEVESTSAAVLAEM
ncbi:MAG: hypothetical protein QM811_30760 [Pirellulales bacterium]